MEDRHKKEEIPSPAPAPAPAPAPEPAPDPAKSGKRARTRTPEQIAAARVARKHTELMKKRGEKYPGAVRALSESLRAVAQFREMIRRIQEDFPEIDTEEYSEIASEGIESGQVGLDIPEDCETYMEDLEAMQLDVEMEDGEEEGKDDEK